jgi:hypothetical protein
LYESGLTVPVEPLTAPMEEMLAPLGEAGYLATAHQLGLTRPLAGLPSQPARLPNLSAQKTVKDLAVTPLHLARVIAALELDGQLPNPVLSLTGAGQRIQAFSPASAGQVRALLPQVDEQIIGLSGQATPQETGRGWLSWFVGLAPAQASAVQVNNLPAMLPLDPAQAPAAPTPTLPASPDTTHEARYVVVAVVTEEADDEAAYRVGRAPLKVLLDQ